MLVWFCNKKRLAFVHIECVKKCLGVQLFFNYYCHFDYQNVITLFTAFEK